MMKFIKLHRVEYNQKGEFDMLIDIGQIKFACRKSKGKYCPYEVTEIITHSTESFDVKETPTEIERLIKKSQALS